jgi:hypothetical protein
MNTLQTERATIEDQFDAPRSDMTLAGELLTAYSNNNLISLRDDSGDATVLTASMLYAIGLQLERIAAALEADRG